MGIMATGFMPSGVFRISLTSSSLNAPIQHVPSPSECAVSSMFWVAAAVSCRQYSVLPRVP